MADSFINIRIPKNLFAVFDEVLFKVLLLLYALGKCDKNTKEEDLGEDETCYTDIEVSYISNLCNLEYDVVVDAIARLVEEGFVIVRKTEETEDIDDLISYWVDYSEIESLSDVPDNIALYDKSYKICLYPEDNINVTEYLMDIQEGVLEF